MLGLGAAWNQWRPGWALSAVGLALLSSTAHMAAQFFTAYQWFVPHSGLLRLLPVLLSAALIFGLVSGLLAQSIVQRLASQDQPPNT